MSYAPSEASELPRRNYTSSESTILQRQKNANKKHRIVVLKKFQENLDLYANTDILWDRMMTNMLEVLPFETLVTTIYEDEYVEFVKNDPQFSCLFDEMEVVKKELGNTKSELEDVRAKMEQLEVEKSQLERRVEKLKSAKGSCDEVVTKKLKPAKPTNLFEMGKVRRRKKKTQDSFY